MFWFETNLLKKLCTYPKPFSDTQKMEILKNMEEKVSGFMKNFSFKEADYFYLSNHELDYINCLIKTSKNENKQEHNLNNFLYGYGLKIHDSKIYNTSGSTCDVFIEQRGETFFAKKIIKSNNEIKYLKQETKIYSELKALCNEDEMLFLKMLDFDEESLTLEVASDTLRSYILAHKQISLADKIGIIINVCCAVDNFHKLGFLHRDLHPGNFFVFQKESQITVKLGDFGLSIKSNEVSEEVPRNYYGARDYISPEQSISLSKCSILSEVFSLGKIINFIMTESPKNHNHELSSIALKCINNNPSLRFSSVDDLIHSIKSLMLS